MVLLSLLYDTGARVQEMIDLTVGDVRLDSPAQVTLPSSMRLPAGHDPAGWRQVPPGGP